MPFIKGHPAILQQHEQIRMQQQQGQQQPGGGQMMQKQQQMIGPGQQQPGGMMMQVGKFLFINNFLISYQLVPILTLF